MEDKFEKSPIVIFHNHNEMVKLLNYANWEGCFKTYLC